MRRYIFRLHVSPERDAALREHAKMMADLWNALKQRREDVYRREGRALSFFDLTNEITDLRRECPEWRAVPAITAHRIAKQLTDAYAAFFRRLKSGEAPGYPAWRRRDLATTIPLGTMDKTGWTLRHTSCVYPARWTPIGSVPDAPDLPDSPQGRADNPYSWRLHYGSLTDVRSPDTWIRARGILPAPVSDWRNADIIRRDNAWWLSVCVEIAPRRHHGRFPVCVEFGLLDELAQVNGIAETPEELRRAQILQDDLDALKSSHDLRWPRGRRSTDEEQAEFLAAKGALAHRAAFIARLRRNALHVWSARIVEMASDLTIVAPRVQEHIRTPRGDAKHWGANVEAVSALNRNTLSQAPATAIQMLRYKAEEAGIRCDVVTDIAPDIAVGGDLVTAGKTLRRARRATKERKAA